MQVCEHEKLNQTKKNKKTVTCDFQQCGILTSVDSDGPIRPIRLCVCAG